jgi:arylsulfatase A
MDRLSKLIAQVVAGSTACLAAAPAVGAVADSSPPNIVLILADDLGLDGVGAYGADNVATPAMDALASEGLRFTRAYATPMCAPSRAQLMTGQYPFRNGCLDIGPTSRAPTPANAPSMARVLADAGYATAMAGKWRQMGGDPGDWGFEKRIVSPTSSGYYWADAWSLNGEDVVAEEERYFPRVMQDWAEQFIRDHRNEPFFLYYSTPIPHVPVEPPPASLGKERTKAELYRDSIQYLDQQIGSLVNLLESLGLEENTLFVVTSDNGTYGAFEGSIGGRELVGAKGSMHDGGVHVPLLIKWPDGVSAPGTVSDALVDFSDFLPTFAEVADGTPPIDEVWDGVSFVPVLEEELASAREWLFVQRGEKWFVQNRNDFRLDHRSILWDVSDIPFSQEEVALETPDLEAVAARLSLAAVLDILRPKDGWTMDLYRESQREDPGEVYLWKRDNFSRRQLFQADISSDRADPDNDGLVNLGEMALGGDPWEGDAALLPEPRLDGEEIRFTVPHAADGTKVRVETSSDMKTWVPAEGIFREEKSESTSMRTFVLRLDSSAAASRARYFRLVFKREE